MDYGVIAGTGLLVYLPVRRVSRMAGRATLGVTSVMLAVSLYPCISSSVFGALPARDEETGM